MTRDAFIFDAVRTPRAKRKGKFSGVHAVDLLAHPLTELLKRTKIPAADVADVVVGCVTQIQEQGWCVGRRSVLASGMPYTVPATTVNRLCGSGQQAANFVAASVSSNVYDLAVAGGVEHMTRVPMFADAGGEESPMLLARYPDLVQQGLAAELVAEKYKLSRQDVDSFACSSQKKAANALTNGHFSKSIISVPYRAEDGSTQQISADDNVRPATTVEALAALKLAFKESGVITAGNASAIVDGAAAMLIGSADAGKRYGLRPRARIVQQLSVGSDPKLMLTGPIEASRQVLKRAGLTVPDIDLWEINEAFAPIPLITMRDLKIDPAKVNVNGGGISLGHPLGATGVMLLNMAVDELERTSKRYALVTMCIGLGMAIATIIERQ